MPDEKDNLEPAVAENSDPNINVDAGNEESAEAKNWFDEFPADLKADPSIIKFKSPADMAKSYRELSKVIGKDKIVVPTEKSTPAEWEAFWAKAGRPKDVNGYEVPTLEMPEEIRMREEGLRAFKEKAHGLGLTKKQFAELYGMYNEMTLTTYNQQLEQAVKLKEVAETDLRKEFGAAYQAKVEGAQGVINKFFDLKDASSLEKKAFEILANSKFFIKGYSKIADVFGEDSIHGLPRNTLTPQEAKAEIARMMTDVKGPLMNDLHPEHSAAVERIVELRQLAEAGEQV